jgi:hypothetical protein
MIDSPETNLEIIFQHDRLAVEVEVAKLRIASQQLQQLVDQLDQPEAKLLKGQIPFAVPVRVRDDVKIKWLVHR